MLNYALRFSMLAAMWSVCALPSLSQEFLSPTNTENTGTQNRAFLQSSSTRLLAPNSVDNQSIPIDTRFNYGSSSGQSISTNATAQSNQNGTYAQSTLPQTGTAAVNLNTVDCPFINSRDQTLSTSWFFNPARNLWVNLQESAASADQFINSQLQNSNNTGSSNGTQ